MERQREIEYCKKAKHAKLEDALDALLDHSENVFGNSVIALSMALLMKRPDFLARRATNTHPKKAESSRKDS